MNADTGHVVRSNTGNILVSANRNTASTVYYPRDLAETCQPTLLEGQFCMAQDISKIPNDWEIDNLGDWFLGSHARLPVYRLLGSDGVYIGWLVGYPIRQGRIIWDRVITLNSISTDVDKEIDELHYDLTGSFAMFIVAENSTRIILDAAGSLSVVYSKRQKIVASSPALVPYENGTEDNTELIELFGIPQKNNWFPFGLTPRNGVFRLLPNHSLNLSSFAVTRNWPKAGVKIVTDSYDAVVEISSLLEDLLSAIAYDYNPWLSLTAGMDSRVLLACARRMGIGIQCFTVDFDDPLSNLDCKISSEIAKRFGLRHEVISFDDASDQELRLWMYRIGCSANAVRAWYGQRAFAKLGVEQPHVMGVGAEVASGIYWRSTVPKSSKFSAKEIVDRLRLPCSPRIINAASEWLNGVSGYNTYTILDLLYIEQRIGCWASVVNTYANPYGGKFTLFGFAGRRLYDLFLSLPPEYRASNRLPFDLIKLNSPDLMTLPFNRRNTFINRTKTRIKESKLYALLGRRITK